MTDATKTCKECKRDLPVTSYHKSGSNRQYYQSRCKQCYNTVSNQKYHANKPHKSKVQKRHSISHTYIRSHFAN